MSANLEEAATLEKCLRILKRIHSCGDFFAWQILFDLLELGVVSQKKDEDCLLILVPGPTVAYSSSLAGWAKLRS